MEVSRLIFRTMLAEAIQDREKIERNDWGYHRDSAMLSTMRQLLKKTESDTSTIYLVD